MKEPLAHSHLLQHYSQKPTFGNSTDDTQPMNGLGNVEYIHNGVLISHKEK
jgi:hypothetical protein